MQSIPPRLIPWFLALAGALLWLPGLGLVHLFDWDEINFAEISREMLVSGNYSQPQMRFLPFWEKPPLFFWLQAGAMKLFGVNEWAARLPNAICGMVTLPLLFHIGRRLHNKRFGLIWALVYAGSLLPGLYFQSGIIDPVFNLFIFTGIWFLLQYHWKRNQIAGMVLKRKALVYLFFGASLLGLAVLTKGPAAFAIVCLTLFVYWLTVRFRMFITVPHFLLFTAIVLAVSGIWYITDTLLNGSWFVRSFLTYNVRLFSTEDAGHGGFPGYHFVVVFLGCFPASLFLFPALWRRGEGNPVQADMRKWMIILMCAVLVLFSVVESKIVHYSSMTYYPITYLAALYIFRQWEAKRNISGGVIRGIQVIGLLIAVMLITFPILGLNIHFLQERTTDVFANANMDAEAGWTGWEVIAGMLFLGAVIGGTVWMKRSRTEYGVLWLFAGVAIALKAAMVLVLPKVEAYSQRAAIEFFEQVAEEDAYVAAIGYKTYADAFYGQLEPAKKPKLSDFSDRQQKQAWERWLMTGEIDKPVYFLTRVDRKTDLPKTQGVQLIAEKNGFLLYYRKP